MVNVTDLQDLKLCMVEVREVCGNMPSEYFFWVVLVLKTADSFQNQHYSKEIFTWHYRKPLPDVIDLVICKIKGSTYSI